MATYSEKVLELADSKGLIRSRDLVSIGVPRSVLARLVDSGQLVKLSRGLYSSPNRTISEYATLAELSKVYPQVLVCLMSALRFHGLTTQAPQAIWIAVSNKAYVPNINELHLRVVRFSGKALDEGREAHQIDGVTIHVTCVAKTVADCFKYRNKIGLDVAIEALHEAWASGKINMDELWYYAGVCRVANVMRPYLESLAF